MSFNKSKLALAVAAAAGLTFSSGAFATNGIMQAGNGMAAHGLGGAGISNANEAMSGYDNPALISQTGDSLSMGFSIFMPDRQVTSAGFGYNTANVSDNKVFAIPQVGFTSKINDGMSWGILVNALGGMNTDYRTGMSGTTAAQTVDLSGMIIAPTMSFALNKNASLGASLLLGYTNLRVRNLFGGTTGNNGTTNEGSTMAYGVKLGADFKVADGISVGAVLQPKMSADEFDFFKSFLGGMGFTGDAALVLPNTAGVGAKFAASKNLDVVGDIMFYQWSDVDVFKFFGWEDQIVYKIGVEFRPSDKLALRAGFNYGKSPIEAGNRTGNGGGDAAFANYPFPAISESHITIGVGYKMDKNMAINAYYLHSPEACQTATTSSAGMTGGPTAIGTEICMSQNAFGLGINYTAK
jgi:long-chain fatty acid transport protein